MTDYASAKPTQLSLFAPVDIFTRLNVRARDVFDWYDVGFLSFNPRAVERWERWMYQEVVFVRDLMRREFSLNLIRRLLPGLERSYTRQLEQVVRLLQMTLATLSNEGVLDV